jgi:hypothetical protein
MGHRLTWVEICQSEKLRGRWVALDHCRYDHRQSSHPIEGELVDDDEELSKLFSRLQERNRNHCAIVFCEDAPPCSVTRPTSGPSRSPRDSRPPSDDQGPSSKNESPVSRMLAGLMRG